MKQHKKTHKNVSNTQEKCMKLRRRKKGKRKGKKNEKNIEEKTICQTSESNPVQLDSNRTSLPLSHGGYCGRNVVASHIMLQHRRKYLLPERY